MPPTFVAQDEMPCFNVTSDGLGGHTHDGHSHEDEHSEQEDGQDLSSGAIAGIVVGCVAGVALVMGAAWLIWRRWRAAREEVTERQSAAVEEKVRGLESRRGSGQASDGTASAV